MSKYLWYALGGIILGMGIDLIYDKAADESISKVEKKLNTVLNAEKTTPKAGS